MHESKLSKRTVFVQYLVSNPISSKSNIELMEYYTSLSRNSDDFYLGRDFKKKHGREELEKMVDEGKLVKLPKAIILPYEKDLFLDKYNKIIMAVAWAPSKEQEVIHTLPDMNIL